MTLAERLKKAQDEAGPLVKQARETGLAITFAREKDEATAELDAKFEQQHTAASEKMAEVSHIQSLVDLEKWEARQEALSQQHDREPTEPSAHRPPAGDSKWRAPAGHEDVDVEGLIRGAATDENPVWNQFTRMDSHQRAMYARAGVETYDDYRKFNRVKRMATEPYLLAGPTAGLKVFEDEGFKPEEAHALISTNDELGGFLTDDDFRAMVIRDLAGRATMRPMCRVIRTGSPAVVIPTVNAYDTKGKTYSTKYSGSWKREGYVTGGTAPPTQDQPRFGNVRIPVHVWAPDAVELTTELLSDARTNIMSLLAEVIAETQRLDEDSAFTDGDGDGKPEGVMANSDIQEVASGTSGEVTYDGLITLWTTLPAQYRSNMRWVMNSLTYGAILKLKDTDNRPLFPVNSMPGTLWGRSIAFNEFMPDVAADAFPIIIGDFRYYAIVDRMELRMKRLVERYAPNLGLLPSQRVGGQVLRPVAFRKLKCAA